MYKVVRLINNKFVSAFVYNTDISQEYKINEFVYCKENFPFMVFDTLENAFKFISHLCNKEDIYVFQCSVVNPRLHNKNFIREIKTSIFYINFNNIKFSKRFIDKNVPPVGTVFCDAVSLSDKFEYKIFQNKVDKSDSL